MHGLSRADEVARKARARVVELNVRQQQLSCASVRARHNASQAQQQATAFFAQVAQHGLDLRLRVRAVRKRACQHVADMAAASQALASAARNSSEADGTAVETHLGFLERRSMPRCPRVTFVSNSNASVWTSACKLVVVREDDWTVRSIRHVPFPSLDTPRSWHATALTHEGTVLVVGGRDHDRHHHLGGCEWLRAGEVVWRPVGAPMPTPRLACAAVCVVRNAVVVVAGGEGEDGSVLDVVEAFDTAHGSWRTLPRLPVSVKGCGMVSWQSTAFVLGGEGQGLSSVSSVWSLDLDAERPAWTQLPSMSTPRSYHGVTAGRSQVFVCAGYGDVELASCEAMGLEETSQNQAPSSSPPSSWSPLPSLPRPVHGCACCYGGGNVFVVGGYSQFVPLDTVFVLNLRGNAWAHAASTRWARVGCSAVCVDRRVLVLGGATAVGEMGRCEALECLP